MQYPLTLHSIPCTTSHIIVIITRNTTTNSITITINITISILCSLSIFIEALLLLLRCMYGCYAYVLCKSDKMSICTWQSEYLIVMHAC